MSASVYQTSLGPRRIFHIVEWLIELSVNKKLVWVFVSSDSKTVSVWVWVFETKKISVLKSIVDDMIFSVENPKESTKNLELISSYYRVAGYVVNIQNQLLFFILAMKK